MFAFYLCISTTKIIAIWSYVHSSVYTALVGFEEVCKKKIWGQIEGFNAVDYQFCKCF